MFLHSDQRRRILRDVAILGAGALAAGFTRGVRTLPAPELCAATNPVDRPLHVPRGDGRMGRLTPAGRALVLRAVPYGADGALAFVARFDGRDYVDPTLSVRTGERVAIKLENGLAEPTVAHWHGLAMDTANDGNGDTLIEPGKSFDYAFEIRNRAGLYWYHPHPHGAAAAQTYRGLFGLIAIDDDESRLRTALSVVPGETEIPLVLQDRRSASRYGYSPSLDDQLLGSYGDEATVNFAPRAFLDVAARRYRFRILNASNARNFRLAFRRDDGAAMPFLLLGTDGGLIERAIPCNEVLVSPAERIDLLVDFAGMAIGGYAMLESRAFDPMHALPEGPAAAGAAPSAGETHDMRTPAKREPGAALVADGAALQLLQFRIRTRAAATPPPPAQLSALRAPLAATEERPLRLGFAKGRWRINDRVYDMTATPIVVARNAIETWLLRNYHTSMPHAMHLHGFQFRVLERETSPDAIASLVVDKEGRVATDLGWKDTVLVWPGESVKVAIDFRHPFAGEQTYLFHCHNLEHEDGGMMLRVKVG